MSPFSGEFRAAFAPDEEPPADVRDLEIAALGKLVTILRARIEVLAELANRRLTECRGLEDQATHWRKMYEAAAAELRRVDP